MQMSKDYSYINNLWTEKTKNNELEMKTIKTVIVKILFSQTCTHTTDKYLLGNL